MMKTEQHRNSNFLFSFPLIENKKHIYFFYHFWLQGCCLLPFLLSEQEKFLLSLVARIHLKIDRESNLTNPRSLEFKRDEHSMRVCHSRLSITNHFKTLVTWFQSYFAFSHSRVFVLSTFEYWYQAFSGLILRLQF